MMKNYLYKDYIEHQIGYHDDSENDELHEVYAKAQAWDRLYESLRRTVDELKDKEYKNQKLTTETNLLNEVLMLMNGLYSSIDSEEDTQ